LAATNNPQLSYGAAQIWRKTNEQELDLALNDLLIAIYAQKRESEYQEFYIKLIERFHWENNNAYKSMQSDLKDILSDVGCENLERDVPKTEQNTKASVILGFILMKIRSIMIKLKR